METKVQKWGNSLALRIPKAFAEQLNLGPDTAVQLTLDKDRLLITPVKEPAYTLAELLEGLTPDMLHGEVDSGTAVGAEEW